MRNMRKKQADTDQSLLQKDAKAPFRGLGAVIATCLAVAVAVGYLVWAACAFGDRQRAVVCTNLEMTFLDGGEYRLVDSTYVKQYLAADGLNPVGRKRGEIRTEQMEAGLRGSEFVKSAECYLSPSGVAHMRVRQRTPKFRVMAGADDYYVDADRHVLRPAAGYAAYLPVVSGSVLISAFAALTVTPMLSTKLLKRQEKKNWFYRKTEPFFTGMNNLYSRSLKALLRRRWIAFPIIAAALGIIYVLWNTIPAEMAPLEDRSQININTRGAEGITYEFIRDYTEDINQLVDSLVPDAEYVTARVSSGSGSVQITL